MSWEQTTAAAQTDGGTWRRARSQRIAGHLLIFLRSLAAAVTPQGPPNERKG